MRLRPFARGAALVAMIGAACSHTIPSAVICLTAGALLAWWSGLLEAY